MEPTLAVDRILEMGNLTDNLRDAEANWLLNWGTSAVRALVEPIADEDAGWEAVSKLTALMRALNKLAATASTGSADHLTEEITAILGNYAALFATADQSARPELAELVAGLRGAAPMDALQSVVNFAAAGGAAAQRPGTSSGGNEPPSEAAQNALREGYAPDYLAEDHPMTHTPQDSDHE